MKYVLALLVLTSALVSNAQIKISNNKNQPVYFLDSVKYNRFPVIDLNSIEAITVLKDKPGLYPNGAIYITSKADARYNFISLEQLAQKYVGDKKSYMIMIDNEFITNMNDVVIDSTFVLSCEIVSSREFVHLQHMPEMIILQVTTATKENIERSKKIMIRG
jgi:hypothetical protein